jgi:metal-responsive CopG/Arc/MetJ family transcriptional regulator
MTKEDLKIVQVYVKENFYNEIQAYCKNKNISISAALRIALKNFVDDYNKTKETNEGTGLGGE